MSEEGLETAFAQLHFPAFLSDLIKERLVSFEEESSLTLGFVLSVFVARMTLQAILFFVLIALFLVLLFVLGRIFSALIAKIPVIALFAGAFFDNSGWVSAAISSVQSRTALLFVIAIKHSSRLRRAPFLGFQSPRAHGFFLYLSAQARCDRPAAHEKSPFSQGAFSFTHSLQFIIVFKAGENCKG